MHRPHTVSPIYEDSATGERVVDFQVDTVHHGSQAYEEDFIEQADGSFRHIHQDDPSVDPEANSFYIDDYIGAVIEAFPNLQGAVHQAADNPAIPSEYIDEWNSMMDADDMDLDRFHELKDFFLEQYNSFDPDKTAEASELQQWFDELPQEEIEAEVQQLHNQEFTPDMAEQFVEIAQGFDNQSPEHSILKAGVDLSFGKASMDQVIESLVAKHGEAATTAAYYSLVNMLSN